MILLIYLLQPSLSGEDSVGNSTCKDQAVLVVPSLKQYIDVKQYCLDMLPEFCHNHITDESENKEVIALIDLSNIHDIPVFVQDLYKALEKYDVTIRTGVDYCKCPVTCLALHILDK